MASSTSTGGAEQWESTSPRHLTEELKAERIQEALQALPGWLPARRGTAIARKYALPGHRSTVALALFVTEIAQEHGAHADLDIRPRRLTVTLTSRAAGGVTQAELDLAQALELRA
jgi:4a-hydroxytetrahydrobiopterin dehydratase